MTKEVTQTVRTGKQVLVLKDASAPKPVKAGPTAQVAVGFRQDAVRSRDVAALQAHRHEEQEQNTSREFKHPLDVSDEVLARCSPEAMADVLAWRAKQGGK